MKIGYACLALAVPDTAIRKCLLRDAEEARLHALIRANLDALSNMVDYNIKNGILLYRISSDVIPFASSAVNTIPWRAEYGERLASIGGKIRESGMRVSMHPGQYTVLNSPDASTAENAVKELDYHAHFLDALGVCAECKIILHVGGAYGDKKEAVRRFRERWAGLDGAVRSRLVIENDDRVYHAEDVLEIGLNLGIPVVYDSLHNLANPAPAGLDDRGWIAQYARTWQPGDGAQKIHYSQGDPDKRAGAHSLSIALDPFLAFHRALDQPAPDIMLEVKDKNISAMKCMLALEAPGRIGALEREWGRWKYLVLERSQDIYRQIRELLKDKDACRAQDFFRLTEAALALPVDRGSALNALQHVWGYVKDTASASDRKAFLRRLGEYGCGRGALGPLKRNLYAMAREGAQQYLLDSYYFVSQYDREEARDAQA